MKSLGSISLWMALAVGLMTVQNAAMPNAALAEGSEKKLLYLFNTEFPPRFLAEYPQPAVKESEFWTLLDAELTKSEQIGLTEALEKADYRVKLNCAGMRYCSQLQVTIQNADRDVLATYNIKARPWIGSVNMPVLVKNLSETLQTRIAGLQKGQEGNFGYIPVKKAGEPPSVAPAPAPELEP